MYDRLIHPSLLWLFIHGYKFVKASRNLIRNTLLNYRMTQLSSTGRKSWVRARARNTLLLRAFFDTILRRAIAPIVLQWIRPGFISIVALFKPGVDRICGLHLTVQLQKIAYCLHSNIESTTNPWQNVSADKRS